MAEDNYNVRMRPVPADHILKMLPAMLMSFGGEVLNVNHDLKYVEIQFPDKNCAKDFRLEGHTFASPTEEDDASKSTSAAPADPTVSPTAAQRGEGGGGGGGGGEGSTEVFAPPPGLGDCGDENRNVPREQDVMNNAQGGQAKHNIHKGNGCVTERNAASGGVPSTGVTELYKARHTGSTRPPVNVTSERVPLSDSDNFFIFVNIDVMAPLTCGVLLLYSLLSVVSIL
eukprot:GHVQ01035854.1.p1 GENE.GHVQ01035854.1~~GHVQ01035854.1.p1  ORF type:complete len:228 (+),score=59.23 GHVQ01035854.1:259-942(+)